MQSWVLAAVVVSRLLSGADAWAVAPGALAAPAASFVASPIPLGAHRKHAVAPRCPRRPLRGPPLRMRAPDDQEPEGLTIDDAEWKVWTARFSGQFVTKSGTATRTSRRAAEKHGSSVGDDIVALQLDAGRSLSEADLDAIAAATGGAQSDVAANLREWMAGAGTAWGNDAGDSSAANGSSEVETKTLLYLLAQGRVAVKAVVPRDPSSLIDKFIEVSDQPPAPASSQEYIPYWVQLWPSAIVLADEFASGRIPVADQRVLELSGGLGLPGVTAAVMGAEGVMVTEYDKNCLAEIERNAEANRVQVETSLFDWFRPTGADIMMDVDEWDVIGLADVMYEDGFVRPVARAVHKLLRQNRRSKVVFVDPQRKNLAEFCDELRGLNLQVAAHERRLVLHVADADKPLKSERHAISVLLVTCGQD